MQLSIVIVNYKTPDLLLKCVESVTDTIPNSLPYEVIVVDNNSNDNSEELLRKNSQEIIWIQKEENDGFGRANNVGIEQSRGAYILLLNSDIILKPGTIEYCLEFIKKDQAIGVLGCQLLNEDGTIQKSTYSHNGNASSILRYNLVLDYIFKLAAKERRLKAVMGSFMLIPKAVLDKVGLFDPDFFMYSEEIDLCRRIEKSNYKLVYFSEATAIHKQGGSSANEKWSNRQKSLSNALLQYKSGGIFNYLLYHFISFSNAIVNFLVMWLLTSQYRKGYWIEQKSYFSNLRYYIIIPLIYSRKTGNGKRLLRRS